MSSVVAICNLALSNLGKASIVDIGEASAEARACAQFYPHTRDTLLQAYPWRFAGKTVSLAALPVADDVGWGYAYARPSDCLKVIEIAASPRAMALPYAPGVVAGGFDFDIQAEQILCNISPAFLRYTARIVDAAKFPPLFQDALAWHLAVRLAMPLTRDPKIRAEAWQLAQTMERQAAVSDANEVRTTTDFEAESLQARDDGAGERTTHPGFRATDPGDPRTWDDSRFWVE